MERNSWELPRVGVRVPRVVEAAAFWSAIALPFVYLPLLFVGLDSVETQLLFAVLVALNVVTILLGHRYGQ